MPRLFSFVQEPRLKYCDQIGQCDETHLISDKCDFSTPKRNSSIKTRRLLTLSPDLYHIYLTGIVLVNYSHVDALFSGLLDLKGDRQDFEYNEKFEVKCAYLVCLQRLERAYNGLSFPPPPKNSNRFENEAFPVACSGEEDGVEAAQNANDKMDLPVVRSVEQLQLLNYHRLHIFYRPFPWLYALKTCQAWWYVFSGSAR
jgi:hypothetical protein